MTVILQWCIVVPSLQPDQRRGTTAANELRCRQGYTLTNLELVLKAAWTLQLETGKHKLRSRKDF